MEALPTRAGLSHRIPTMGAACGLYGEVGKSGLHALIECSLAKGAWEAYELPQEVLSDCTRVVHWWAQML